MLQKQSLVISPNKKRPILADITLKKGLNNAPIIIFCHGYKGFKDWGAWDLVANSFANHGFFFMKFNFSHNGGTIKNPIDFPDLEAFAEGNFSKEISDIGHVIDHLESDDSSSYDIDKINIIGHSRGGGMAIIRASIDPRIKSISTWAGIAEIERRFPKDELLEKWKSDDIRYVLNGRTNQKMPHYYSFYLDYIHNKSLLNIESATKKLTIPQLIINGTLDKAVKPEEAQLIQKWNPAAILHIINKCGHTFGTKHPWNQDTLPAQMNEVIQKTITFLQS